MTKNHCRLPRMVPLSDIQTAGPEECPWTCHTRCPDIWVGELVSINMRCQGREGVSPAAGAIILSCDDSWLGDTPVALLWLVCGSAVPLCHLRC